MPCFRRLRRVALGAVALAAAALPASAAQAYEDKVTAGVHAGYGLVAIDDTDLPAHGAMVGLAASVGLDDIWSVRGHVSYAYHPGDDALQVALLGSELLYLLDVVRVVPYFGLGLDALGTLYDDQVGLELGAHLVLGLEYLLSRESLIGIDIRPHVLPLQVNAARLDPVYITATARFSLMFDM